jgi:hypothetical protein
MAENGEVDEDTANVYRQLFELRLDRVRAALGDTDDGHVPATSAFRAELVRAQRAKLDQLYQDRKINDEIRRVIARSLDLQEGRRQLSAASLPDPAASERTGAEHWLAVNRSLITRAPGPVAMIIGADQLQGPDAVTVDLGTRHQAHRRVGDRHDFHQRLARNAHRVTRSRDRGVHHVPGDLVQQHGGVLGGHARDHQFGPVMDGQPHRVSPGRPDAVLLNALHSPAVVLGQPPHVRQVVNPRTARMFA